MDDELFDELNAPEMTPFHQELLDHCRNLLRRSQDDMQNYYDDWDARKKIFKGEREPDKKDIDAARRGDPTKVIVPLTGAQVGTFVAFCFMLFFQKRRFFEYVPTGTEDFQLRDTNELIVERDLRKNQWAVKVVQLLTNVGRFGLGVVKHTWTQEHQTVKLPDDAEQQVSADGVTVTQSTGGYQRLLAFEGNKLVNVSPYRWFPDTRLPITRFQEGEFCASEEERTRVALLADQAERKVAGIDHVRIEEPEVLERLKARRLTVDPEGLNEKSDMIVITEMQVKLTPSSFEVEGKKVLGDSDLPIKFVVLIANDSRIISIEPLDYVHDKFTYDAAQLDPDEEELLGDGLTEPINGLQDLLDWFLNSRVASVRRTLGNQLVVDTRAIDMASVESNSRIIKTKRSAQGDLRRHIHQLSVQDVTANHLSDIGVLGELMQQVTGVSDNAMGQFASGRRSATEARAVNQGAASRLKTIANVIWTACFEPLGQKLSSNLRSFLSEEQYLKIVGPLSEKAQLYPLFSPGPVALVGSSDFFVYDGTLPTEKGFIAQSLQELLIALLSNPQAALTFDINPKELMREIQSLRGATNLDRFSLTADPALLQQLTQTINANAGTTESAAGEPAAGGAGLPQ